MHKAVRERIPGGSRWPDQAIYVCHMCIRPSRRVADARSGCPVVWMIFVNAMFSSFVLSAADGASLANGGLVVTRGTPRT